MRNIENNLEKLTGMEGKSYHGNMTENGEIKKNSPKDKEAVKPVENKKADGKQEGKSREADWKNFTDAQKKEYFAKMEKLAGESAKEKEPGLFDILMDILKDLFGIKDKEARAIIDNSEAMRGVQAYWRIKPQNKWDVNDYGRVFFMLASDTSAESKGIQTKLETDARNAGIGANDISNKAEKIAEKYRESFPKRGDPREISGHEEMTNRAIAMNTELREETWEKEFQEGMGKAGEAIKKFSLETKKQISKAIESGDPEYFKHLLGLFEKYKGQPTLLKRTAENYLSAYEFNEENGVKISENAKQVADLMKDALSGLGFDESSIDSGNRESESRGEVRKILNEERGHKQGGQGENAEEEKKEGEKVKSTKEIVEEEIQRKKREKWEEYRKDTIGKVEKHLEKLVEQGEISIEQRGEILEAAVRMSNQLESIDERLDKLSGILIAGLGGDPNALRRYREEYLKKHRMRLEVDSALNELAGGREVVVGGETDKELYEGNIDQALEERINRIEYFIEMRKGEGKGDFTKFDQAFLDRMKKFKVYEEIDKKGLVTKQEELYFKELQRWTGTILKNTDIGYEGQRGKLNMPSQIYKDFREVRDIKDKDLNYSNPEELEKKLLEQIKKLRELNFLDYFKNHSYLNFEGKGINPLTHEVTGSMGYPHSLEGTMMLIAHNKGKEWQTGGDHELVDAEGKFHRENFLLWMRKEINTLIDWDPIAAINAQQGITFKAGFSQLTLFDILYLPQYTQHQEFEISGDAASGNIQNGWGLPQEHPDMKYAVRVNGDNGIGLLLEAWENDHEHRDYAMLNNPKAWSSATEWLKAREEISGFNNYTRAGLAFKRYMEGSHKGKEIEDYYEHGKQGSLGKAIQTGHLFFRYFSDFTENYTKKGWDEKENRENIIEVDRDNMAYQALGHNGASYFLQSLAESAFDHVDNTAGEKGEGAREKIKGAYRDFIVKRAEEIKGSYNLDGEKKDKMDLLVENFVNERTGLKSLKGEDLDKIKIRLDSSKELTDLKMHIESKVLGKRIVSQEERKKYNYSKDKVVVREDVEKEISGKMRRNIGEEFFKEVLKQKISYVPEAEAGDGSKKGIKHIKLPGEDKQITIMLSIGADEKEVEDLKNELRKKGVEEKELEDIDINIYTDANGRIVTKNEWSKIDAAKRDKTTVGDIVRGFTKEIIKDDGAKTNQFVEDEEKLAEYEDKFGPIYKKYQQAKKDNSSNLLSIEQEYKKIKGDYDAILGRNESLGLALLTKVGNISRDELNMFKRARTLGNASTADVLIKGALTKSLVKVYGLDEEIEGTYAFHRVWYPLFYMGIAGINNTSGFSGGIQPEAEYARFMKRRISRFDLGMGGGSKETLIEFRALIPPTFLEWTRVKKPREGRPEHMLIEILQGGEGRDMKPYFMRDLEDNPAKKYEIPTGSESAFHEDGLKKAEVVRSLVIEDEEHEFEKVVYKDIWGVQRVDHEKAIKIFGKWWDNIRQLYNNHGIDFESKIAIDGREVTMMDQLFGKDTQETLEIMKDYYNEYAEKLDKKGKNEEAEAYRKLVDEFKNKPALAVFLNSVTASIHEHREMWDSYEQWPVDIIDNIWSVLDEYLHQKSGLEYKVNDPKIKERPSMIPYELFNRLLGVHNEDSMEKFMFWDLFKCLVGGFIAGLGEAQKELEDELKGQPVKQWIG